MKTLSLRFDHSAMERLRSELRVLDIASRHTELKQVGDEYVGRCPIPDHDDSSPSFTVNESKNVWHCFGCDRMGFDGDAIGLIQAVEGVGFQEAVLEAADITGIDLGESESDDSYRVRQALHEAERFYSETGRTSGIVETFRDERSFSEKTVDAFAIGYAPNAWDGLSKYLSAKGIKKEVMLEAGLVRDGKHGTYDVFRDRIIFPIRDRFGRTIAFAGRRRGSEGAKYVNSPNTRIYTKGHTLFGVHASRKLIRSTKRAVLVEGYTDVMRLWEKGIGAVSPCGTQTKADQLRVLSGARRLLIWMDGDDAGQNGARRAAVAVMERGMEEVIVAMPAGEDPDSWTKSKETEEIEAYLEENGQGFVDSVVGEAGPLHLLSPHERRAVETILLEALASMDKDWVGEYARDVVCKTGVDGAAFLLRLDRRRQKAGQRCITRSDDEARDIAETWRRFWNRSIENADEEEGRERTKGPSGTAVDGRQEAANEDPPSTKQGSSRKEGHKEAERTDIGSEEGSTEAERTDKDEECTYAGPRKCGHLGTDASPGNPVPGDTPTDAQRIVDRLYPEKEEEVTAKEIDAINRMKEDKTDRVYLQNTGDLSNMEQVLVALAAEEGRTVLDEVANRLGREGVSATMRSIIDETRRPKQPRDRIEVDRIENEEVAEVIGGLRTRGVRLLIEEAERESGRRYAAIKEMVESQDTQRIVTACCNEISDERRTSVREKAVVSGNARDLVKQLFR